MSTPTPSMFRYSNLRQDQQEIRLVRLLDSTDDNITCELQHFALDSAPQYTALSYMWGNPERIHPVIADGRRLNITKSLEIFFQEVLCRRKLGRSGLANVWSFGWLWIDAVCINQDDEAERSEQVTKMREIYENAHMMVIWLGESFKGSDGGMDVLKKIGQLGVEKHESSGEEGPSTEQGLENTNNVVNASYEELPALSKLLNSPYWDRAWILQEASTPKNLDSDKEEELKTWVCYGSASISWKQYAEANSRLIQASWDNPLHDLVPLHNVSNTNIATIKHMEDRRNNRSFQNQLYPMMVRSRTSEATNPRDKLYAILGLVDERNHDDLQPNYKLSVETVFTNLAKTIINLAKSLDCLGSAGLVRDHGVPSWVPDWTVHHDRTPQPFYQIEQLWDRESGTISSQQNLFDASNGMKPEISFQESDKRLIARGIVFDAIEDISVVRKWPDSDPEETWRGWTEIGRPDETDYISGCTRIEAFGKVLTADFAEVWGDWSADRGRDVEDLVKPGVNIFELHDSIVDAMTWQRRMFITNKGYLGIAPAAVQPGDVVCILYGSQMPMVLRREDDHCIFVGQAYIHGLMDGEALNDFDIENESELFKID